VEIFGSVQYDGEMPMVRKRRNAYDEVLSLIRKEFPKRDFPRVADIAGGDGRMAKRLTKAGYRVTVIDPEESVDRRYRKIHVLRRKFLVKDAENFDLLVALSPCGASQKAIRAAKRKPIVFVPCICRSVWPGRRNPDLETAAFFRKMKVTFKKNGSLIWSARKARK
jgi:SAM-dependent methyltransferase